jgi:ABC-2 type transport system permease protein
VHFGSAAAISLIAHRELVTRLRSKAFAVTTAVTMILVIGFAVVMKLVAGGSSSDATVGFTPAAASLAAPMRAAAAAIGQKVSAVTVTDEATGRRQVDDGTLNALVLGGTLSGPAGSGPAGSGQDGGARIQVVVKKDLDGNLRNALNVLAGQASFNQQITQLGGDPARVNAAVAAAGVDVQAMQPPFSYQPQQLVLGIIAGVLIYMSLMIAGQAVAQGVVEEKSSRVVELLLSTVRPWQLMTGKVVGIGTVGLIQVLLIGAAGVAAGLGLHVLTIPVSAALSTVAWLVVWYLLGFFAYSLVFAALGALVSRQEDVGGVVTPALAFVISGYVLGISILPNDPSNRLCEILSIIPVFAPTLMPMRLAMGGVPVWEAALAVILMIATIPGLVWLAARIYRNAVIRTGAKVRFREALRPA